MLGVLLPCLCLAVNFHWCLSLVRGYYWTPCNCVFGADGVLRDNALRLCFYVHAYGKWIPVYLCFPHKKIIKKHATPLNYSSSQNQVCVIELSGNKSVYAWNLTLYNLEGVQPNENSMDQYEVIVIIASHNKSVMSCLNANLFLSGYQFSWCLSPI